MRENGRILVKVSHTLQIAELARAYFCGPELRRLVCKFDPRASAGEVPLDRTGRRTESRRGFPFVQRYNDLRGSGRSVMRPFPSALLVSNASTSSVLPQKGSNLGSRNMGRILPLSITFQSDTPPHNPRWRHPPADYVRRLPRPTNPPPPQSSHVLAFPPRPPRIRTLLRARVQGGSEYPGCEHRRSRTNPR